nr:immunoglobulin heavy chain junction region [Mus musculus]MBK4197104.1 immunoglobulin heavy chain junction region [Mus musculus]
CARPSYYGNYLYYVMDYW